jgi:hypothetical protein
MGKSSREEADARRLSEGLRNSTDDLGNAFVTFEHGESYSIYNEVVVIEEMLMKERAFKGKER